MHAHRNNFGLIRLVLASLVIIGHAPELVDGNRSREPLTQVFHTLSLGELAVDGFFLISGYLITMSMLRSASLASYTVNRVLRIYPAFVAAFLIAVFVLGPLVGGAPFRHLPASLLHILTLQPPAHTDNMLRGLPYPDLDDAMWTIAYEFRCYILVGLLWATGLLRNRRAMLVLAALFIMALLAEGLPQTRPAFLRMQEASGRIARITGDPLAAIHLTAAFLVGGVIYLYWPELERRLTPVVAGLSAAAAVGLLFWRPLAEPAVCVFAAAPLFWFAAKARIGPLQRINDRWDISYGVYLYGWPISTALLWFSRGLEPATLALLTLPLAALAGAASWWGLEKHTKDLGRRWFSARRTPGSAPETSRGRERSYGPA